MSENPPRRILAAMSGGVDSSVAAALLQKQGHEVIGTTLRLWRSSCEGTKGCCSDTQLKDASNVCGKLGIPHYVFDLEERFREKVVDDFVEGYLRGDTPNPCVQCNLHIKFGTLFQYAGVMKADSLATGHYANIGERDGLKVLKKAKDLTKDQSYFLYMLTQTHLSHLEFPLGVFAKTEVREMAKQLGLPTAQRAESQDACFLEGKKYQEFLKEAGVEGRIQKGEIRLKSGKVLGEHRGLAYYTIGQREGLGIATGSPLYVIEKETDTNTLVVGSAEENSALECSVNSVNWCSGQVPETPVEATVKIRYRHQGAPGIVTPEKDGTASVRFKEPQASVTPGQSAVFYNGDEVLGGGTIRRSKEI